MIRPFRPLYELLLALFRSNDALAEFLVAYPSAKTQNLVASLPDTIVPRTRFVMRAVEQLQAHGIDKPPLFDAFSEQFPGQSDLIAAIKVAYFGDDPAAADRADGVSPVAQLGNAPTAGLTNAFEKIMGDRPTFLDVSYLAIGYQRAKAVAKLRMRFGQVWYSGTAFLVRADLLFTAHHNLWAGSLRADAVEVVFDYELSASGSDMESSTHVPNSFFGNEKEDWAILKLAEPQVGRPLAPLGTTPAKLGDRVAIIQHPNGMPKQVALHHNLVTYVDKRWMQYFTDTLPGSSGSPVFDAQWNVVAIHHKGGNIEIPGKKETVFRNQGIVIERVVAGISELGIKV